MNKRASMPSSVSPTLIFAVILLLGLVPAIGCKKPEPVRSLSISVSPNPVKRSTSGEALGRWDFNVVILNSSNGVLTIDGYLAEIWGEDEQHMKRHYKYDSADIAAFGQGARWEAKGERIQPHKQFELSSSTFSFPDEPLLKGTETRTYRLRRDDGSLVTADVVITLLSGGPE